MILQAAAGGWHSVLLTSKGQVLTCGMSQSGQLGHGDTTAKANPTIIDIFSDMTITDIACGSRHTVLLTSDGDVYAFGCNTCKQVTSDNNSSYSAVPVLVEGIPENSVKIIACGSSWVFAIAEEQKSM